MTDKSTAASPTEPQEAGEPTTSPERGINKTPEESARGIAEWDRRNGLTPAAPPEQPGTPEAATPPRELTKEDWVAMKELLDEMRAIKLYGVEIVRAGGSFRCTRCGADWPHHHNAYGDPYPVKIDKVTGEMSEL